MTCLKRDLAKVRSHSRWLVSDADAKFLHGVGLSEERCEVDKIWFLVSNYGSSVSVLLGFFVCG